MRHLYKKQLVMYAQKLKLPLPAYSAKREGPVHESRFKSKVTIDGETYGSPEFTRTIKEAEHAALLKLPWKQSVHELQEDDSGFYKNFLRELAKKEGLDIIYETNVSGPPHMRIFVSTVVIRGQPFEGQAAKTKKKAETNAAKAAYTGLQEDKELVTSLQVCLVPSPNTAAPHADVVFEDADQKRVWLVSIEIGAVSMPLAVVLKCIPVENGTPKHHAGYESLPSVPEMVSTREREMDQNKINSMA